MAPIFAVDAFSLIKITVAWDFFHWFFSGMAIPEDMLGLRLKRKFRFFKKRFLQFIKNCLRKYMIFVIFAKINKKGSAATCGKGTLKILR